MAGHNPWSDDGEAADLAFSFGEADEQGDERALFAEDPLDDDLLGGSIFKQNTKKDPSTPFNGAQLGAGAGAVSSQDSGDIGASADRQGTDHVQQDSLSRNNQPYDDSYDTLGGSTDKSDPAFDYHISGPGRRVGYADLSSIDWIFEHTKERQRLKKLYAGYTGPLGRLRPLLDSSHVWFVLICSGIAIGVLAACIDIAGDWLGDLKTGYCKAGPEGGRFYLNKTFCCWGYD
ncbi:hypothetical protein KEM56_004067, partial [Ascosphaera pollenicola]